MSIIFQTSFILMFPSTDVISAFTFKLSPIDIGYPNQSYGHNEVILTARGEPYIDQGVQAIEQQYDHNPV